MAANSSELTISIETSASVSAERGAAVEEVFASTVEVSVQAKQVSAPSTSLMGMANTLQNVAAKFKLQ